MTKRYFVNLVAQWFWSKPAKALQTQSSKKQRAWILTKRLPEARRLTTDQSEAGKPFSSNSYLSRGEHGSADGGKGLTNLVNLLRGMNATDTAAKHAITVWSRRRQDQVHVDTALKKPRPKHDGLLLT